MSNNNWHEKGERPPVGSFVEGYVQDSAGTWKWLEVEVLKHNSISKNECAVHVVKHAILRWCDQFRPIQSERDKPKSDESNWHEKGELPPFGIKCQFNKGAKWVDAYTIGCDAEGCMVVDVQGEHPYQSSPHAYHFRPIFTERDKLVEKLSKQVLRYWNDCLGIDCDIHEKAFAGFLIDHGYRPVKQQTEGEFTHEASCIGDISYAQLYRAGCRFVEVGDE